MEMALPRANDSLRVVAAPGLTPLEQEAAREVEHIHKLHGVWEKNMKDYSPGKRHKRVVVLLLYWDKIAESYLDSEGEVSALHDVFKDHFRYTVYKRSLNSKAPEFAGKEPALILQKYLSDVVLEIDGPNSLLIVYYAGHGNADKEGLVVTGGNYRPEEEESKVIWNEAEAVVKKATRADVFLIFDCCYAGRVTGPKTRAAYSTRNFEYIAASDATTKVPGKQSFTSALMYALVKLCKEPEGFTTLDLWESVRQAPHFPENQTPVLGERWSHSSRRLMLAPLPDATHLPRVARKIEKDDNKNSDNSKFGLCLQIAFAKLPGEHEMLRICTGLKRMIEADELPATQIHWKEMHRRGEYAAHQAARYWYSRTKRLSMSNKSPRDAEDVLKIHPMTKNEILVVTSSGFASGPDLTQWKVECFLTGSLIGIGCALTAMVYCRKVGIGFL